MIKPVPPPISFFSTPFCLYLGILKGPKNSSNSLKGSSKYLSKTGRSLLTIILTTEGETSLTTLITASS